MIASQASFHRDLDIEDDRGGVSLGRARRRQSDRYGSEAGNDRPSTSIQPATRGDGGNGLHRRHNSHGEAPMNRAPAEHASATEPGLTMLLNDAQWKRIENLPEVGRMHDVGRRPTDDREVLEAVLWVMKHQARWQDLPADYPSPRTCQRRLRRWQDTGTWDVIWRSYLDSLEDESLHEWGETFLNVVLADVTDGRGQTVGEARIGRPPFWLAMGRDFWRITWDRQPDELKQELWAHSEALFGEDAPPAPAAAGADAFDGSA